MNIMLDQGQGLDPQLVAAIVGGLIGIMGSIAALIASHFLRISGKIIVGLSDAKITYYWRIIGESPDGPVQSIENAEALSAVFALDMYNSSDIPRSLRKLCVELRTKDKKRILNSYPEVYEQSGITNLEIINLPSKELQHTKFRCLFKRPAIGGLKGEVSFYLKALYPNGRKFKAYLVTQEIK